MKDMSKLENVFDEENVAYLSNTLQEIRDGKLERQLYVNTACLHLIVLRIHKRLTKGCDFRLCEDPKMLMLDRIHEKFFVLGFAEFDDPSPQTEASISTLSPELFAKITEYLPVVRDAWYGMPCLPLPKLFLTPETLPNSARNR